MSAGVSPTLGVPRRRADAQRSIEAIVGAARAVLGERPNASMEDIAAAAGVTRQTVYAHFPSRDAVIMAVFHAVRDENLAALEAAQLDDLPPVAALREFLAIGWQLIERCAVLLEPMLSRIADAKRTGGGSGGTARRATDHLIAQIVRRGQDSGDFARDLPADWLVAATHSLIHAAAEQVFSGKLPTERAGAQLEISVLRLYGARPD